MSSVQVARVHGWWLEQYQRDSKLTQEEKLRGALTPTGTAPERRAQLETESVGGQTAEVSDNASLGTSATAYGQDDSYAARLLRLASTIREQMTVPLPDSRVREVPVSRHEFLRQPKHLPGSFWYWGWEVDEPVLVAELHLDYPILRNKTTSMACDGGWRSTSAPGTNSCD